MILLLCWEEMGRRLRQMIPHLRNCLKKMLMFRLLFPSSRFTSDISFFFFSPTPFSPFPSPEASGAFGATRQNRFSMSRKSIGADLSFSNVFAIFVQMLFFPKILFTGSLFQANVFILFFGFGVSS